MSPKPTRREPSAPLIKVLNRLSTMGKHPTPSADGHMAQCPCHDDKKQSLSLSMNEKGDVLMNDHAGCKTTAIVAEMGMTMAELFVGNVEPPTLDERALGTIKEVYSYTDEKGALQYEAVRYEPKGFRQRRPDRDNAGGYIWNMQGVHYYLYRLPEFLKRKHREKILIVEGEKDVHTLLDHKMPATTSVGGASKKWKPEYTEQLQQAGVKQVAILPDHDDAGQRYAEAVAVALTEAGIAVKVVALPVPEKGDVSDYLADHSREDLSALLLAAPKWAPTAVAADEPAELRFNVQNLGQIGQRRVTWFWKRHIPLGRLVLLAGPVGGGKSTVTDTLEALVTTGANWPDGTKNEWGPSRVLYIGQEDSLEEDVSPRVSAAGGNRDLIETISVRKLTGNAERSIMLTEDIPALRELLRSKSDPPYRWVTFSPLQAYMGSAIDIHKDGEARSALTPLAALAAEMMFTVWGIMHFRKEDTADVMNRIGGSVAFGGVARAAWTCLPDPDARGRRYFVHAKMSNGAAPPGWPFTLSSVHLPAAPPERPEAIPDVAKVLWEAPEEDVDAVEIMRREKRRQREEGKQHHPSQQTKLGTEIAEYLARQPGGEMRVGNPDDPEPEPNTVASWWVGLLARQPPWGKLREAARSVGVLSEQRRDGWWWRVKGSTWRVPTEPTRSRDPES